MQRSVAIVVLCFEVSASRNQRPDDRGADAGRGRNVQRRGSFLVSGPYVGTGFQQCPDGPGGVGCAGHRGSVQRSEAGLISSLQVGAGFHESVDDVWVSVHPHGPFQRRRVPVVPHREVSAGLQERSYDGGVGVHAGGPVQRGGRQGVRGVGLAAGSEQRGDDGGIFVPGCPVHGSRSDSGFGAQFRLVLDQRSEHVGYPVEHGQVYGSGSGLHRRVRICARFR